MHVMGDKVLLINSLKIFEKIFFIVKTKMHTSVLQFNIRKMSIVLNIDVENTHFNMFNCSAAKLF